VVAGSFNAALIPTFIKVRDQQGHEAAQQLLSSVMFWTFVLLGAVTLVLFASVNSILPWVASGFSAGKLALTRALYYLLLPTLVLSGFSTIWAAILNAGQTFALPALVPAITPTVSIIAILAAGKVWGIHVLALAALLGAALEVGILGWKLKARGYSVMPLRLAADSAVKEVFGQYLPMVVGLLLMSSTLVVDQSMAAMLGSGSVAALGYGNRVVGLIVGIGSLAIGTSVLPYFSRMVAAADWPSVRRTLKVYLRLLFAATIIVTGILICLSRPIVTLLFERGNFSHRDTLLVSRVQTFFALQIPFYVMSTLLVRLVSSFRANHILMWGALISVLLNVVLNYVFMKRFGVAGISLSTSVVYLVSFLYLFIMLGRLLRNVEGRDG